MPLYIAKSGDLDRCHRCLTDSQSKDSATQLLTKYKSGALVTQLYLSKRRKETFESRMFYADVRWRVKNRKTKKLINYLCHQIQLLPM